MNNKNNSYDLNDESVKALSSFCDMGAITEQPTEKQSECDETYNSLERHASDEVPDSTFLLAYDNGTDEPIYFMPTSNIGVICGHAKVGKTTVSCIIIASVLGYGKPFNLRALRKVDKVLLIDTEQDEKDQNNVLRNINRLCGKPYNYNNPHIVALHCEDKDHDELMKVTQVKINQYKPQLVYIDGIRDYLININDDGQVDDIMTELKKLKKEGDCFVLNALHTNKDELSKLPRGVLGTELLNKSSDVFLIEKDKETQIITIEHERSRHLEIPKIQIRRDRNNYGLPMLVDSKAEIAKGKAYAEERELANVRNAVIKALKDNNNEPMKKGELVEKVSKLTNIGVSTLKRGDSILMKAIEALGDTLVIERGRSDLYSLSNPDNHRDTINVYKE